MFAGPISLLSMVPKGHKFLAFSEQCKVVTWFVAVRVRSKDPFELAGSVLLRKEVMPSVAVWIGDEKVSLQTATGQVLQVETASKSPWLRFR
jgi:hypothetical protein